MSTTESTQQDLVEKDVEEISGLALDFFVAKIFGKELRLSHPFSEGSAIYAWTDPSWTCEIWMRRTDEDGTSYSYQKNWDMGGPLLDKFDIGFGFFNSEWLATGMETNDGCGEAAYGPDHLTAACRVAVITTFGRRVMVPKELLEAEE